MGLTPEPKIRRGGDRHAASVTGTEQTAPRHIPGQRIFRVPIVSPRLKAVFGDLRLALRGLLA